MTEGYLMKRLGVTAFVLCSLVFVCGCPASLDIVIIPDVALENSIRAELNHPFGFITRSDLLDLRVLEAREKGIRNLTGLEHCENLTWLDLEGNAIADITPLSSLVNLGYLNLERNNITDIGPLAGLFHLKQVMLAFNEIWTLEPLVANAENGGMGYGSIVVVSKGTLIGDGDEIPADVADHLARLADEGVLVIFEGDSGGGGGSE